MSFDELFDYIETVAGWDVDRDANTVTSPAGVLIIFSGDRQNDAAVEAFYLEACQAGLPEDPNHPV